MKSELTLVELAQELDRQQHAKKDYLATETALEARTVPDDGGTRTVVLDIDQVGEHTLTPHAHGQIGTYLHIPRRYYSRVSGHCHSATAIRGHLKPHQNQLWKPAARSWPPSHVTRTRQSLKNANKVVMNR
jgi:hypothetical protein